MPKVGMQNSAVAAAPHQVIMQDRRLLEMTGVSDVDSFDDTVVVAHTSLGELTLRGKGLHVRQLDVEHGLLSVEGEIDTLSYAELHKGGFFGRLLR